MKNPFHSREPREQHTNLNNGNYNEKQPQTLVEITSNSTKNQQKLIDLDSALTIFTIFCWFGHELTKWSTNFCWFEH